MKRWKEKLHGGQQAKIVTVEKRFADMPAGCTALIATPELVDQYIRRIPHGCQGDVKTMREDLAREFQTEKTCPVTTGIFLRIVAEAAYEDIEQGTSPMEITPFWRLINAQSKTAKKLSFDTKIITDLRVAEGISP